jgi:cellulose synthase operon protein C
MALGQAGYGPAWPGAIEVAARDLESRDRSVRTRAVELLAELQGEPARALLRGVLDDPDPSLRQAGARILVATGDRQGLAVVIDWVATGFAADRVAGLEALRLLPALPPTARTAVERALSDPEPNVRLSALEVLGHAPSESFPIAVAGRLDDTIPAVRLAAVRLLADVRDPRASLPLIERLGDSDRQIQREAIAALARLGDPRAEPALLRMIETGSDDLRLAAVDAVGALRLPGAVTTLAGLAGRRPADPLTRQAQRALGEIGTAPALAALVDLIRRPPVTEETEEALSRSATWLPALLDELEEAGPGAPTAAVVAGRLRDARALPALLSLARRGGPATVAAVRALGAMGTPEVIPALVEAAEDRSATVRQVALEALLTLGDERAAAVLPAGLTDRDPDIRLLSLRLAARLRAHDQARSVERRLLDVDPAIRRQAVMTLGQLEPAGSALALAAALPLLRGSELLVGTALARVARKQDLPALTRAAPSAQGASRLALLAGLVAALEDGPAPPSAPAAIEFLVGELMRGGAAAELAAEALTVVPIARADDRPVRLALRTGTASVRARLCAGAASSEDGRRLLVQLLVHPRQSGEVQAAAAWALAGVRHAVVRRALDWASRSSHPAVAANARAALAMAISDRRPQASPPLRLRLVDGSGSPAAGRWLIAHLKEGPVWIRSGTFGQARLSRAGDAPVRVEPADRDLRLTLSPADGTAP